MSNFLVTTFLGSLPTDSLRSQEVIFTLPSKARTDQRLPIRIERRRQI